MRPANTPTRLRFTAATAAVLCAAAACAAAVQAPAADGAPLGNRFGIDPIELDVGGDGPFVPIVGEPDYGTAENGFGAARSGHVHEGQDMFAPAGTAEVAATDGVIAEVGSDGGQGNYVYLYDPERDRTYVYMHMIEPAAVKAGDRVEAGEKLGGVGCTGSCWGDHLHFEVRGGRGITGVAQDPMPLLSDWDSLDEPR
jgi:murein DD-endopeptidase MepM/ murein hydrolase activator NlpD